MNLVLIASLLNIGILAGQVLYVSVQMRKFNRRMREFDQQVVRQIMEDDPKLVDKVLAAQAQLVEHGGFNSRMRGEELALKYAMQLYGLKG